MSEPGDPDFYTRSKAIINLCNEQLSAAKDDRIAASAAFAAARFSVWSTANRTVTKEELVRVKQQAIETFVKGFEQMLEYHFHDYVENFDTYYPPKFGTFTRPG